ncbi:MAG TPA: NAD(P)-dependent alcohol dehydrogenase [Aggregatilineales bacterium]|nr:NAD(P)-dependent alcohol dehydrogenase [Aggregatilineales bacterium]
MKTILYTRYGSPDVLHLREVATPTPKADEVLVKIHAAGANPLDWHLMRAKPFLVRLDGGLRKPKNHRLGADIAGRVEAVGTNVTTLRPGDEVFGDLSAAGLGGFAEYVCVRAYSLVLNPANLSFESAAGVPVAGITALQGLRTGNLSAGQKVLINGASGGVGTFAVQIAKAFGAEVTAVCSGANKAMVQSIGADHVIDYTQEDFTRNGRHYDLILEVIGNRTPADLRRALSPEGVCVVVGFTTLARMFNVMLRGGKTVRMMGTAKPNQADLAILKDLLESGKVTTVIDRCYTLSETPEAIRYLESGRAKGKVIIVMG